MEYQINQTPFEMVQICEKLFNNKYLSDITFIVEGREIYAHSLILMLRSSVFQQQLDITLGEKKLIPVDCSYDTFHKFIKFIYTDQYHYVERGDFFQLLELAKEYNVIRLINILLNLLFDYLNHFDISVSKQHKTGLNVIKNLIASDLKSYLDQDEILKIHPETMQEILKFDQISNDVTELDILDVLVHWMNHYCVQNQIQFPECRQKFEHLIRLIRFPTMSNEELRNIKTKYPELLTKSDFLNIGGHKMFGSEYDDVIWNCSPRTEFVWPFELKAYPDIVQFKTKFSVSSDLILGGFAFGRCSICFNIQITITCDSDMDMATQINLKHNTIYLSNFTIINLGASIRIRPDFIYTIEYTYHKLNHEFNYVCRKPQTELIIYAPPNSVQILEAHGTMFEILFLQPEDA